MMGAIKIPEEDEQYQGMEFLSVTFGVLSNLILIRFHGSSNPAEDFKNMYETAKTIAKQVLRDMNIGPGALYQQSCQELKMPKLEDVLPWRDGC